MREVLSLTASYKGFVVACSDCRTLSNILHINQLLMCTDHKYEDQQKEHGKEHNAHMAGDEAEKGRHKAGPHIGTGHLHSHDGLGSAGAKVMGSCMEHAGINGGAAQADHHQSGQRNGL